MDYEITARGHDNVLPLARSRPLLPGVETVIVCAIQRLASQKHERKAGVGT